MKLSDYLVDFLANRGIRHVFQIIGGASVHMVDSLSKNKDITYICVQHEQAGAMAAEAYSRMTKNLGAAMATSGPGMTNLITGIACAYFDSTPTIYLTGQVNTFESKGRRRVRQVGFQETDIVAMVKPVTKFAQKITDPQKIRYTLEKAIYIAKNGRPGPVLIDIPMDIQMAQVNPAKLLRFDPSEIKSSTDSHSQLVKKAQKARKLISNSVRPVVIAGGGIRYADVVSAFKKLVNILGFPVVSTWSGIDVISHDHPLYIGQIGVYGSRAANFTVQNSDCVISLGSRLDTRITGGRPETFARCAKKIIVDIDRAEIFKHRGLEPDIGICGDLKEILPLFITLLKNIRITKLRDWLKKTTSWKKRYPSVLPVWRKRENKVDPYVFVETLSNLLPDTSVTITDIGANLAWTIQAFHVREKQRLFSAMGNAPMGYSLSAGIGASFAMRKKPIICITGDGGLQINIQELQTIVYYKLPLKVFILNNHSYGIIKQFQDMYFNGKYLASCPKYGYSVPDFIKIAKAYGIATEEISSHKEMKSKIKKVLKHQGPIICDVILPDDAKIIPKLEFGKPIEDLSPLLPRSEFVKNMIIDPI